MTLKVAINGFGRIGRLAMRRLANDSAVQVVAINDISGDASMLAHLFKYDTAQGRFDGTVESDAEHLIINGKSIKMLEIKDPTQLPWGDLGIDVVLECTGVFASKEKSQAHINAGAKRVLISAPAGNDVPTVVYGVNQQVLKADDKIVSGASCTTNCLAPMAKVLQDSFGIEQGVMTTIHAYTGDQMTLDGPHRKGDKRRARAAAANIVPNSTGAAKAIGLVIPELQGKLDGAAQRVPVPTGSLTELVTVLKKAVTKDEINAAMKAAVSDSFGYTEEELVSSDIIGITQGSLFDATQTKIVDVGGKQLVKTVAWYDNEMSYTCQLVRTLKHLATV
ncbi:MAG: type I glyceraldehyde-3-phosphate dehydrogenase [Cardiobacteriaceae bacterium]|nr:type I glyceraldehyde-3-phosphate dehydrogenase [Cardiobacteriaceae bacterium]